MALDLTGISNENEFYTHHYLTAILENDLKGFFSKCEEQEVQTGVKSPYDQLARLHRDYFSLRNRMERLRKPEEILVAQRELLPELLSVLGYEFAPDLKELDAGAVIPIIGEVRKKNGAPDLWIIETISPIAENTDPLESSFMPAQYGSVEEGRMLPDVSLTEIITKQIYTLAEPPRWIILLSLSHIILLDRSKWSERRFLRFDLSEILSRRVSATLRAMSALLHRENICPEDGISLLDTLDESSHKHAFAVSEDLKYSAREAVEILGNEAVCYIRNKRKEGVFGGRGGEALDEQQLTRECLRYLYRLLFLFYIEARPELGYAPMNSEEYRTGYSLEDLRDLELQPLTEEPAQNGFFIHDSLQTLFRLIFDGFNYERKTAEMAFTEQRPVFRLFPLSSHLFDPSRTPLLNGVKFRNVELQKVLALLSLSRERGGNKRRGRISYAQLGINQLGAVYEGLLSYSGFFAKQDLYEVKKAGTEVNELEAAFFVNADDFQQYEDTERVFNSDGTHKTYPRGTFIYRLAGRNREKTASYYTPEVLTRCLVKYALKELLKDKTADDILKLTVCELAMGSAAFLNEAINQLAEAYLERKQKETGETIAHDAYGKEKQKVKAFIADNNVFGVDLNPVAVELAEVSLWLNAMYVQDDGAPPVIPWFGNQLVCGNSLVGARRQVFDAELLEENRKGKETWLDAIPSRVPVSKPRPPKSVYHFLLPDTGMANYTDKVVRGMAKKETKKIKEWRKDFIQPFNAGEIETLRRLSDAVDKLWQRHAAQSAQIRFQTRSAYRFFGYDDADIYKQSLTTKQKDDLSNRELLSENIANSSPFRRLKVVMDYWCALWFWPIQEADKLPSRDEFLIDLTLILEGTVYEAVPAAGEQLSLLPDDRPTQQDLDLTNEFGHVNVDALCRNIERLALVRDLADKHHFHHWELVFADIFAGHGGFDLNVGNPPWIKIEWNEGELLGDYDPLFVIRNTTASQLALLREEAINKCSIREEYLDEFVGFAGTQNFLNAFQNYPILKGTQSNLYKCFLPQAWLIGTKQGVSGFLHPEGVYDDPGAGFLREQIYPKLRYHLQFQNELKLFQDIGNREKFSINIYGNMPSNTFAHISNLFHPSTVDASFNHNGFGLCDGIKDDEDQWNLKGHSARIVLVDADSLMLFAKIYDETGTPALKARLPVVHSQQIVEVLRKFATQSKRLGNLAGEYFSTVMWDEANAQKAGIIRRLTQFPDTPANWILSGPHFYVGRPFHQTPKAICETHRAYDNLDLTMLPDDYLPRANYIPACNVETYLNRTPKVSWDDKYPVTDFFRVVTSKMLSQSGERTLQGTIIPKGLGHIDSIFSMSFRDNSNLVNIAASWMTLPFDFFIKTTGKSNFRHELAVQLPIFDKKWQTQISLRTLALNCLTILYAALWEECWNDDFRQECWTKVAPRLDNGKFTNLTPKWQRNCALRTDYERRQALVELDVLAAMALGLTLDELCTIYRIQFPVLRQNENDTWYDQNGRIVFTCSKGLPGVGFSRPEWNDIKNMKSGTVSRTITDDTLPGGPRERTITYTAPFDRCDREADYATAWATFEKRGVEK
ncbi:MAG: Eco57I restriction-modification methylase domain-containing protein [Syntrophales bacterium]